MRMDAAKLDACLAKADVLVKRMDGLERRGKYGDAAWEQGLEDNEPRVVQGTKGVQSRPFSKRFPNAAAMDKWMDGEGSDGDYDIQYVKKA